MLYISRVLSTPVSSNTKVAVGDTDDNTEDVLICKELAEHLTSVLRSSRKVLKIKGLSTEVQTEWIGDKKVQWVVITGVKAVKK